LVYSDGLTEAENAAGLSFGDLRLPELFASQQSCTAEKFADSLLQDVLAWSEKDSGPGQTDDITFVVVDLG
jgi:serine phosphatase RsbU (regulator of sigma subunit)